MLNSFAARFRFFKHRDALLKLDGLKCPSLRLDHVRNDSGFLGGNLPCPIAETSALSATGRSATVSISGKSR